MALILFVKDPANRVLPIHAVSIQSLQAHPQKHTWIHMHSLHFPRPYLLLGRKDKTCC